MGTWEKMFMEIFFVIHNLLVWKIIKRDIVPGKIMKHNRLLVWKIIFIMWRKGPQSRGALPEAVHAWLPPGVGPSFRNALYLGPSRIYLFIYFL